MSFNHDICLLAVNFIKTSIDDNVSIDDMITGLNELSTSIFGDGQSPLLDFVNKHLPTIVHHLEQKLTPEEVCTVMLV